jgi:putative RecB family exonuclease
MLQKSVFSLIGGTTVAIVMLLLWKQRPSAGGFVAGFSALSKHQHAAAPSSISGISSTRLQMVNSSAVVTDHDIDRAGTGSTAGEPLLHPKDFVITDHNNNNNHVMIPSPTHLSPSSAMAFKECPQSFLFQYLWGMKQPTTSVLAKGSLCHKALEHIFDLEPNDRSLQNLQNILRAHWGQVRLDEEYKDLFVSEQDTTRAEREWGQSALKLLENYYKSENPTTIVRPNPYQREVWVQANLTTLQNGDDTFKVRGIVDRIDIVKTNNSREVALRIVDYKTGKAPNLKYSPAMNQKIFETNFWQLKVYALLWNEMAKKKAQKKGKHARNNLQLRYLRLHYLTSEHDKAKMWEMDLGATEEERQETLHEVHKDLANVWNDINDLVATQDPKAFKHCDRSFCYCHVCREKFEPETVFERVPAVE